MLPFMPQTLDQLRERIPEALRPLYGARDKSKPWMNRGHVFDFESGLRLVVTRKVIDIGCEPCLHVAATIVPHTMVEESGRWIRRERLRDHGEWLQRLVICQFRELYPMPLEFLGVADRGVFHFFGEIGELDQAEPGVLPNLRWAV